MVKFILSFLHILGIIIVTGGVLFYVVVYIALSGGISGVISQLKPAPKVTSQSVIAKKENTKNIINESFIDIEQKTGLNLYGTSTHDKCFKGDHSWKRNDSYAHRCAFRLNKYYGFSSDFKKTMETFEKELIANGWHKPWYDDSKSEYPLTESIEKYYEDTISKGLLVNAVPAPYLYEKGKMTLQFEFTEKGEKDFFSLDYKQNITNDSYDETFEEKHFVNAEQLFDQITEKDRYVLMLSIQQDYFEN